MTLSQATLKAAQMINDGIVSIKIYRQESVWYAEESNVIPAKFQGEGK